MKKNTLSTILSTLVVLSVLSFAFFFIFGLSSNAEAQPTVTHYWIGVGTGSWSDGANWSLSSGGASCACVPGSSDVAGFNSNGNGVVNINSSMSIGGILVSSGYTSRITASAGVVVGTDIYVQSPATIDFGTGAWTIGDDVVLTSLSGAPTLNLNSASIVLGGDWNNSGAIINPGTSTVSFNGAGLNQNIFGTNTFYNLTSTPSSTKFLGFQEGTTTTITGGFTLTGLNPSRKVHIQTVNSGGVPVQENATISPQGAVSLSNVTVQYNTNSGSTIPLTSLSDEVVEIVPFSTIGWFPTRGPGGVTTNIETWVLADAVPLNDDLERASNGDGVERWSAIFGGTLIDQTDSDQQPIFTTGAFNFNPALTFDGVDDNVHALDGWTSEGYYLAVKTDTPVTSNLQTSPTFFAPISWLTPAFTYPAGGFALGGNFTSTLSGEVMTHAIGGGGVIGNIYRTAQQSTDGTLTYYEDIPNIYAAIENLAGDNQDLFGNGKRVDDIYHHTHLDFANREFYLGSYLVVPSGESEHVPCCFFTGQIGEVLSFTARHTDSVRQKVLSYLALKYGVTLDQSDGGQDYIASNGTTYMWDDDEPQASTYDNDIAGIGQDNGSALYQPKSRSVNKDSIVTIGDPTDLENMEFLTWGNDNQSTSLWIPYPLAPQGYERVFRVWKTQETGDVGDVTVYVDDTLLPSTPGAIYLLTDSDGNFADATPHRMVKIGGEWQLENTYDFSDQEYFSIAYAVIDVEFQDASISAPENTPATMTNILIQGEVIEPISFSVSDTTANLFGQNKATLNTDYSYTSPQTVNVPAGDYRTSIYAAPLQMTVSPDGVIEPDEYTSFLATSFPTGVTAGDIDGDGFAQSSHNYIILNDDSASITVNPTSLDIAEGSFGEYTISLSHEVQSGTEVFVDIAFGSELEDAEDSGVVVGQVAFDPTNWSTPQTVPVWAVDDNLVEGTHFDEVTHEVSASTTDSNYLLIESVQSVNVTIWDNDTETGGSTGSCPNGSCSSSDPILGCQDPNALNYNPAATQPDPNSPCLYILGETDPPNDYVSDAFENSGECPYFAGFYKLGSEGSMVARWQAFLNVLLGVNLTIDGKFGSSTDTAVRQYHEQWQDIILVPWGHRTPTGYIYKTTNATGNSMIGCPLGTIFISETGNNFNADTYNSAYNLQALTQELRNALNISSANPL